MDATANKGLLQDACRANGIAYDAHASSHDLMRRLMHLHPQKKRKAAAPPTPKSSDVLSQDVFVASETARLWGVFPDQNQLSEEVNTRWNEIRKVKLLDTDLFLSTDVDNEIIEQMQGEYWFPVLRESNGTHYRKKMETATSIRSQQDEEYASTLAADAAADLGTFYIVDAADVTKGAYTSKNTPTPRAAIPTDAPSNEAPSIDSQKVLDAYATHALCRQRVTEWILANGQVAAQRDFLGVHPESALARASDTRPRLLASKIAYSMLPPDMQLKSSLTLEERQKARPGEQWSEEEIAHLGHFAAAQTNCSNSASSGVNISEATCQPKSAASFRIPNQKVFVDAPRAVADPQVATDEAAASETAIAAVAAPDADADAAVAHA